MSKSTSVAATVITRHTLCCIGLTLLACVGVVHAESSDLDVLDRNRDGVINPYEALDALLVLENKNDGSLSISDFKRVAEELRKDNEDEVQDMLSELDANNDGTVIIDEIEDDALDFARLFDTNGDEIISASEVMELNFTDAILSSEDEIQERLDGVFEEFDTNRDNSISISDEVEDGERDKFLEWDGDRNRKVTREEVYRFMKADNTPVEFSVDGDTASMSGVITSELPAAVLQLIFEHPEVATIEMLIVPGSIDDIANLRASLYVRQFGLATKLNSRSAVASGGTDFFLAGKHRIVEKGATIGVHSWSGGPGIDGSEVPRNDPEHQKYIDYYIRVGIPESFYWYTMEAASPSDIHIMTEREIEKYGVRTHSEP